MPPLYDRLRERRHIRGLIPSRLVPFEKAEALAVVLMNSFAEALDAIRRLKTDGLVGDYAIGGAMALVFWTEPIPTFDLDVFVLLPQSGLLISLEPIYEWARQNGYREEAEHIYIGGMPVQVIPAHNELAVEAIRTAAELDYEGEPVRVMRPEYLIALYLEPAARTPRRLERVAALLEEDAVDRALLKTLLTRYDLSLPRYE